MPGANSMGWMDLALFLAVAHSYQRGHLVDGPPTGLRIPTGLVQNTTWINVPLLVITADFGSLFL